tara:strand:+ start:42 stop:233 length:192 start_codon:yes stop_codon:yes gene_type:complete
MFFDECSDTSCLFNTYAPYLGSALALGLGSAILGPMILPAAAMEATVFGVGAETILATGAMAI